MKKVGIVGCGNISGIYMANIGTRFHNIAIAGICDLIREKAENRSAEFGGLRIYRDMYEIFADPEVDIVLNITRPNDHYGVTKAALLAGKNVYSEKPLATNMEDARELVELALEKGLTLGGAPDTFMGAGIQTVRRLIDEGAIGRLVGATAHFLGHGPENWHPDPEFFYKKGGGPMLDMGPYYITTLVNLFGKADWVTAFGSISFPQRRITSEGHYGEMIDVEVDTFTTGAIRFASGAVASFTATFDVYTNFSEYIEVFGEKGSIRVPDPNTFGGPVMLLTPGKGYEEVPLDRGFTGNGRSIGLSDMASAMEEGRMHRANYMQQLHVLDIMTAFARSSAANAPVEITSPFEVQPAVDPDKVDGDI